LGAKELFFSPPLSLEMKANGERRQRGFGCDLGMGWSHLAEKEEEDEEGEELCKQS